MSTADTAKADQCSICLDSPPYSECPGRQCQRLAAAQKRIAALQDEIEHYTTDLALTERRAGRAECELTAALKAKEEAAAALERTQEDLNTACGFGADQYNRAERAEKALEEAQRELEMLARLVDCARTGDLESVRTLAGLDMQQFIRDTAMKENGPSA